MISSVRSHHFTLIVVSIVDVDAARGVSGRELVRGLDRGLDVELTNDEFAYNPSPTRRRPVAGEATDPNRKRLDRLATVEGSGRCSLL